MVRKGNKMKVYAIWTGTWEPFMEFEIMLSDGKRAKRIVSYLNERYRRHSPGTVDEYWVQEYEVK